MIRKLFSWWADGPIAAGVLLSVGVVLAFAPDLFLPMLARAFIVQWASGFFVIAVWNIRRKGWWTVSAALIAGGLTMMPPTPNTNGSVRSGDDAPLLRVAQMNLLQPNDEHAATLEAALATDADVLSFQEVSPAWADALADCLAARYPYSCVVPGTNCYGIALFSRIRFEDAHVFHLSGTPAIDATLRTASGTVRVLCVHATSPGDYSNFRERNEQLALLAPLIAISDLPTVLIGDLNTVSWDHAFRKLCACAGLKERSCDVTATWPSFFGFACIPLDHVLTSDELHISALSTFAIPGSDHRGVVAQLVRAG